MQGRTAKMLLGSRANKLLKTILFVSAIALYMTTAYGQKQGNIWYFGDSCGLDFSNGDPVVLANGKTSSDISPGMVQEGTSCISDSSGQLLFYTGGKTIWNRNHMPMPNGTGLMGGTSSTQSSLVVPLPGSDSIFYVFTSDHFQNQGANGYRYSVVDMCLDDGNGNVIPSEKNIWLNGPSTEKLAACEDANGTGYWITGHKMYSAEFYSWHLTSSGIVDTVISKIGTVHGWHKPSNTWYNGAGQGEMKFNPNGTKVALAISNFQPAYLDLFDFDNHTGVLSNFCHLVIDSALHKNIWGVEFSPDGSKLYATLAGGSGGRRLYQFNLSAGGGNCDSILNSRITLFQDEISSVAFGLQLAPNDKIYIVFDYSNLSVINNPNLLGAEAGFDLSTIPLTGYNGYELPNFIAGYKYHNKEVSCKVSGSVDNYPINRIRIVPNPFSTQTILYTDIPLNDGMLTVQNFFGQTVAQIKSINGQEIAFTRDNLPGGLYFLQLTEGNKTIAVSKLLISDN
jgi:hypothetical protein